jgi:FkbM family methyltransferase
VATAIKRLVISVFRALFSLLPNPVLGILNDIVPKFFVVFPSNRSFLYKKYLGVFSVSLDTRYPIEREMLARVYEKGTYFTISKFVHQGNSCLDVGANVGAISLMLAQRVGPFGKVLAFEPGPLTYNRLRRNISLNPSVANVIETFNLGFSNKAGTLHWNEHENAKGNANLVETPGANTVSVEVTTIDDFFKNEAGRKLDFVKIDVESMEYEVILGGLATLRAGEPVIYYESLGVFEEYRKIPVFKLIQESLAPLGYSFWFLDEQYNFRSADYPHYADNTIAVPRGRAASVLNP